jgi:hypothetical protein
MCIVLAALGVLPLAVVARTEGKHTVAADTLETAWRTAQEELATFPPEARLEFAPEIAHYIQLQQPDLVHEAISYQLCGFVRRSRWTLVLPTPGSNKSRWLIASSVVDRLIGRGPEIGVESDLVDAVPEALREQDADKLLRRVDIPGCPPAAVPSVPARCVA